MNPVVSIRYGRFLDPIFIGYTLSQPKYKDTEVPSVEFVENQVSLYKNEWIKYESKILTGIQEITGLHFERNYIDVFIVSLSTRSFSRPIVMKSRYSLMDFINVLTHELIHCLFSDNDTLVKDSFIVTHENPITSRHIVIHAILKYIYVDVLKESQRLECDIKFCWSEGYKNAWKVVQESDYLKIIDDFKKRMKV